MQMQVNSLKPLEIYSKIYNLQSDISEVVERLQNNPNDYAPPVVDENCNIIVGVDVWRAFTQIGIDTIRVSKQSFKSENEKILTMIVGTNTPYMLRLAYYEGRLPKSKGMKIDSTGLAIIKAKAKCMTKLSKKLTLPNVTAAGQMNRAFEKDLQYHDFKVILPYPELKRAFKNGTLNHGMDILDEEEYQLFKAFRLKNNL